MSSEDPWWPRASTWLATDAGEDTRLAVVGVPLSRTSISPSGADATPAAVRAALRRFPTFHAGLDVDLPGARDLGDLDVAHLAGQEALTGTEAGLRALLSGPDVPDVPVVLLGGDNAVTRPALRVLGGDLRGAGLLTLDAHHDVRGFHAGPTNGTPVRGLLDDGLPGGHVVQVGIADLSNSRAYRDYCRSAGITVVSASTVHRRGAEEVVAEALALLAGRCDRLYVDLDVDVVDAAFAPGCPGGRPGGLLPADLLAAAALAGAHPTVVGVDVVEVDATRDPTGVTVDLAAACLLSVAAGVATR